MLLMCLVDPNNTGRQRRRSKPAWQGFPQNPAPPTGKAIPIPRRTLPGDHQNHAVPARERFAEKPQARLMRPVRRHAMEIDPRIRLPRALAQPVRRAPVETGLWFAHRTRFLRSEGDGDRRRRRTPHGQGTTGQRGTLQGIALPGKVHGQRRAIFRPVAGP